MTTTLLAVDDSVTMRKVLEITFAGENFKTLLASSAEEALAIARREKPAIALLDHTLDGGTGYDLARDLKSAVPGLAVILLSSKQNPFDKTKTMVVKAKPAKKLVRARALKTLNDTIA